MFINLSLSILVDIIIIILPFCCSGGRMKSHILSFCCYVGKMKILILPFCYSAGRMKMFYSAILLTLSSPKNIYDVLVKGIWLLNLRFILTFIVYFFSFKCIDLIQSIYVFIWFNNIIFYNY